MKYLVIMWGAAVIYLIIGIYAMSKKTPMRLSFISKIPMEKISDIPAFNKEIGKMWCVLAIVLFAGGALDMLNPAFSVFFFAIACTVGVGGAAWWQSKIEKKYIEE